MGDTEVIIEKKSGNDGVEDLEDRKREIIERTELPSPTFKTNFAELEPGESHEQKLRDLRMKEERLTAIIRNAKKELTSITTENERKQRMHNIIQLQIAFQREKRLILGHQQAYRIHLAKLYKNQYRVHSVIITNVSVY